jgi:endogenous inhibitor of DNA gyrase (YacG/DUF329 family)
MSNENKININKCLNCGDPVSQRMFLYDSPTFCSGQCKDAYQRRK